MNLIDTDKLRKAAIRNNSPVDLIKFVSAETWNRVGYVHINKKTKMNVHEVTITQNMVYELHKISKGGSSLMKIEEAEEEWKNGADLLLSIKFQNGYLSFPLQAKLLTCYKNRKNGSYRHYNHVVKGRKQMDLINSYAKSLKSHLAFYLFYNFTSGAILPNGQDEHFFGCSVATTSQLKSLKLSTLPKFSEVHPTAIPFYMLFDALNGNNPNGGNNPLSPRKPVNPRFNDVINFFSFFGKKIDENFIARKLQFRSAQFVKSEFNWKAFASNGGRLLQNETKRKTDSFNPKYHIILEGMPESRNLEPILQKVPAERKKRTKSFKLEVSYA